MNGAAIQVTVLVENTARKRHLLGEHGLAFWIETPRHRVLFDTGQGLALAPNAAALGIDLRATDAIVLSHGHYDHTGGLCESMRHAAHVRLFLHPDALRRRYSGRDGNAAEIGLASVTPSEVRGREAELIVWTHQPTEVVPGLFVTGPVPRLTDFEDTGGPFFLDERCMEPDPIVDDQAVFYDTPSGVVVVMGCAHAGVINTLRYVRQITSRSICGMIGGTHLVNADAGRIQRTIAALEELNLAWIAPGHCTGPRAMSALWAAFPDRVRDCSVGTRWGFPERS